MVRPRRWVGLALLPALAAAGCFAGAPGALVATAHRCEPVPLARPCAPVPRAPLASSAAPTSHLCVANNYTHCVAMKGGSNFVIDLARNWTRKAAPKLWFDNRPPRLNNTCWNTQSRAAIGDRGSVLVYRNPFVKFMSAVIHKGLKIAGRQTTTHIDPDDVAEVRRVAHLMLRKRANGARPASFFSLSGCLAGAHRHA